MKEIIKKCISEIEKKLSEVYYLLLFAKYKVKCAENCVLVGRIKITGAKGSISIGRGTTIVSKPYCIPIGYNERCSFWTIDEGEICIGQYVGMSHVTICSKTMVKIGNYVLLGGGVKIYDTDFHSLDFKIRSDMNNDYDRKSKPIEIKDYAFIGAGTMILKGVTIGEKSIVGAGSIVTSDIPAGQIWAGNPAKYIRNISSEEN